MLPIIALAFGFGVVFTQSAFKQTQKSAYVYWRFDSNNASDIRSGAKYTLIASPTEPTCTGNELPCVLKVDESIDSQSDLNTYLNDTGVFPNDASITTSALYKKDGD